MSDALAPKLTASDRRVLAALPVSDLFDRDWRTRRDFLTVWQVAERLDKLDTMDVSMTLNGLRCMEYADCAKSKSRKRPVWWATTKGAELLLSAGSDGEDRPANPEPETDT